jgi:hypothetical protein
MRTILIKVTWIAGLVLLAALLALVLTGHGTAAPLDYSYAIDGAGVTVRNVCGPGGQTVYADLHATDGRARWYDAAALAVQFDFVSFSQETGGAIPRQDDRFLWAAHSPGDLAHITAANQPGDPSCLPDAQLAPLAFAEFGQEVYMPLAAQPYDPTPWPTDTPEPRSQNGAYPSPFAPSATPTP